MKIVHNCLDDEVYHPQLCLVFGAGLIGEGIIGNLHCGGLHFSEHHRFSWNQGVQQQHELISIETRVEALLESILSTGAEKIQLSVVWSAGRGGFASQEKDLIPELDDFQRVLEFADRLFVKHRPISPSLHMLSSAGGLFEGQTNVTPGSAPRPLRPYGWIKLEQERLLNTWNTRASKHCYRPSSVYGFPRLGQRMGLIPTLLQCGMQRRVVNFFGGMDTVRDYVACKDIARFIAGKIRAEVSLGGVFTLASAQPTTLYQLKVAAERCIRRKIYAHFELNPANAADNSFLSSVLPSGWRPIGLETGLHEIYSELLQGGGRVARRENW